MPGFLDDYEPVEERLRRFWDENPHGRVATEGMPAPDGQWVVKAAVWRDKTEKWPDAMGHAHEHVTEKGVNSTSALENCETSAIGRALANLGYAAKGKRPSREEMVKVKAGGEPTQPAHVSWLADQVKIFKAWSDEGKRDAYTEAMVFLGFDELDSMEKAQAVFANMTAQYDQPTELPIEKEDKKK